MGVPCILGEKGIESIVELDLNPHKRADYLRSAGSASAEIERLGDLRECDDAR